jgi:CubicO group peptidase (beta-lactamase class C family)
MMLPELPKSDLWGGNWGGMAPTMFWIDRVEELLGIVMTQKFPTDSRLRDEFKVAVNQAIIESYSP